jgi:hypothetical protein
MHITVAYYLHTRLAEKLTSFLPGSSFLQRSLPGFLFNQKTVEAQCLRLPRKMISIKEGEKHMSDDCPQQENPFLCNEDPS